MQWINEPDEKNRDLVHQALVLQSDEPLAPAFIAFWTRILTDACESVAGSGWASLSIDICERQNEQDSQGWLHAAFLNVQKRACPGLGHYYLRSDAFTLLQGEAEDNTAFNRRELGWYLQHYQALKEAAQSTEVQSLFRLISAFRPLPVSAGTAHGWFDLQIGHESFGELPSEDQALLAGEKPIPTDPLLKLMGGEDVMALLRELGAALVAYTPEKFEIISCRITEGVEQGQRALFYDISCPDFPDDGTTVANDRVHTAATRLVQRMAPIQGGFPGATLRLELQADGSWRHNFKFMSQAA